MSRGRGIKKAYRWLVGVVVVAMSIVPQLANSAGFFSSADSDGPLPVEQAFILTPSIQNEGVVSLDWSIKPNYYLYRDRMEFSLPSGVSMLSDKRSETEVKSDPLFGDVQVFHNSANVTLSLVSTTSSALKDQTITVTYQGCWEGGICYPPVDQIIAVPVIPVMSDAAKPDEVVSNETNREAGEANLFTSEQDQFASLLAGKETSVILGLFLLAGLALSLTPCVFPMIPILSGVIVGRGEKLTASKAFGLSLVYVLAMSLTYTLVGIIAGLFGANLQAAFQHPWVISAFSALFVLLALSMFGFYQLQVPSSVQTWLSKGSDKRSGHWLGVAIMGVLSALIVGPCMAAPLAGALIYIGQTGDPVIGGLALFSLSLGMGLPLLIVGTSAGRYLPKAGRWMDSVKAGFGVLLLLMSVWMLDRIVPIAVTMVLVAVILIVSAIYLKALESLPSDATGWQRLWKGIGVIILIYGASLLVGVFSNSKSVLQPLKILGGSAVQAVEVSPAVTVTSLDQLQGTLADQRANEAIASFNSQCQRMIKSGQNKAAWQSFCSALQTSQSSAQTTRLIEQSFTPYQVLGKHGETSGLITGYYESTLQGSFQKSARYRYPLYKKPDDLLIIDLGDRFPELKGERVRGRLVGNKVVRYYDREAISKNPSPLAGNELIWVDDPDDAFFLEIQGSGRVKLDNGQWVGVGYADQNGEPYYAIGRELIKKGILTPETVSLQTIRQWLSDNPKQANKLKNLNRSYVFFTLRDVAEDNPRGSLNVPLTPERSVAVDRSVIPLGTPLWISTTLPNRQTYQRLVLAQDTGGAIRGPVRADLFFGRGDYAEKMAGEMKQSGQIYALMIKGSKKVADTQSCPR